MFNGRVAAYDYSPLIDILPSFDELGVSVDKTWF
jgi:hypothetical protein